MCQANNLNVAIIKKVLYKLEYFNQQLKKVVSKKIS